MAKAVITAVFQEDIKKVWEVVTDNKNFSWRSDLERIEILDGGEKFVEYTKHGFATTFTIAKKNEHKQYEFDMENNNMSGHWSGIFKECSSGTEIVFEEEVQAHNFIMNLFVGIYLKKQQKQYIEDLTKALGEKNK